MGIFTLHSKKESKKESTGDLTSSASSASLSESVDQQEERSSMFDVINIVFSRPKISQIGFTNLVLLTGNRMQVKIEVGGWGWLKVKLVQHPTPKPVRVFYFGQKTFSMLYPLGEDFVVLVGNIFGLHRLTYRNDDISLKSAPMAPAVPALRREMIELPELMRNAKSDSMRSLRTDSNKRSTVPNIQQNYVKPLLKSTSIRLKKAMKKFGLPAILGRDGIKRGDLIPRRVRVLVPVIRVPGIRTHTIRTSLDNAAKKAKIRGSPHSP